MPYPSEHAARMMNPDDFQPNSFRRENDKFGPGVDAIFGKLKNGNSMVLQAIRFDAKRFTAQEAKDWLKSHNHKPMMFEAAVKGESMEKHKGKKFEERVDARTVLEEAQEGKPRRVRIEGAITANVVNGNGRRYPAPVIEAAVAELRGHLNESAGQGRAIQLLGEAEHPSDKGGRPNLLETIMKWDEVLFDGQRVDLVGHILETSNGKDILTLMEGGVMPGVSLRGYGDGKTIKESDEKIFEVTELHITGFDLVLEPSFENSATLIESQSQQGDDEMTIEELLKLLKEHPELFKDVNEAQIKKMGEDQLKALEESVRKALGIDEKANISEAMKALVEKAKKFDETQAKSAVDTAITEATKELPFGKKLNEMFVKSIKEANLADATAVKQFAEIKRKEYGELAAAGVLKGMGFDEKKKSLVVIGDVLEEETGTPEFARPAFEITEAIRKSEMRPFKDLRKNESRAGIFTMQLLERFDKLYRRQLMAEAQQFQEAETVSDMNMPYSVSRAIIAEAMPNLVAANVFDVGLMDMSPMRIYYEAFAGESGLHNAVSNEDVTLILNTWVDLDYGRLEVGTVVVTDDSNSPTYTEGTDYLIDYELGKIKMISATNISTNLAVHVSYHYDAIRLGENAEIQQGEVGLSYETIEAGADRLADYITHEAIVFSRSQLGWDAVTRTMTSLVRQTRMRIDKHLIEKALTVARGVSSNSGGTWTAATDPWSELVEKIGAAKVLVANRYYTPSSILMSVTNADLLSNWDGFTRLGFPDAILNSAGFAGGVKGLPIFASTQMRETFALVFDQQIVLHRVFQPMTIKGPFPTYGSNHKLVAAEQYYSEEYNASLAPIGGKGSYVVIA